MKTGRSNLVAKSILCQFDVAKKSEGAPDDSDDAVRELAALAQELDLGPDGHAGTNDDDEEGGNDDDDDGEGLGDEDSMSEEEAMALEESLTPFRLTLTKVC